MSVGEPRQDALSGLDFGGRVALVTGGAGGIGRATAELLSRCGAVVYVADIGPAAVDVDGGPGNWAASLTLDVTSPDSWQAAIDAVEAGHSRLDVLVNSAGVSRMGPIVDVSPEGYESIVAVNQVGTFLGMRAAAPLMSRDGGGAIVNLASINALRGYRESAAYASSKAAVLAMTKTAANEFSPLGIRVNAVEPGIIDTPMQGSNSAEANAYIERILALPGRMGTATEVAQVICFLASDMASYVTGTELLIDGGITLGGAS